MPCFESHYLFIHFLQKLVVLSLFRVSQKILDLNWREIEN